MLNPLELSRLKWRCRRGVKELDIMLMRFVDQQINQLSARQLDAFKRLLTEQDPQLSLWLLDQQQPQDKGLSDIVKRIRQANHL